MMQTTYTHKEACDVLATFFPDNNTEMSLLFQQKSIHWLRVEFRKHGWLLKAASDKFYFEKLNIYCQN